VKEMPLRLTANETKLILDDKKTQIRFAVKPQPKPGLRIGSYTTDGDPGSVEFVLADKDGDPIDHENLKCPYHVGDKLWVKEPWATNPERQWLTRSVYNKLREMLELPEFDIAWLSAVSMPKEAALIWLLVKQVRAERLQEICGEDVDREGVTYDSLWGKFSIPDWDAFVTAQEKIAVEAFSKHWDSLKRNRKVDIREPYRQTVYPHSWRANPWCWIVEFERVKGEAE
jgi:hypothetical protein